VNDFNVKLRSAQKFLAEGNRVKVTVRFRGREMAHTDIGKRLLLKFAEDCSEMAAMDKDPKLDGRHMNMFLSPKVAKDEKSNLEGVHQYAKDQNSQRRKKAFQTDQNRQGQARPRKQKTFAQWPR
jgi:hypothetical protein